MIESSKRRHEIFRKWYCLIILRNNHVVLAIFSHYSWRKRELLMKKIQRYDILMIQRRRRCEFSISFSLILTAFLACRSDFDDFILRLASSFATCDSFIFREKIHIHRWTKRNEVTSFECLAWRHTIFSHYWRPIKWRLSPLFSLSMTISWT